MTQTSTLPARCLSVPFHWEAHSLKMLEGKKSVIEYFEKQKMKYFKPFPTYCTTRVTTYTYCTYCCHNTEISHQDFKFSVFKNF